MNGFALSPSDTRFSKQAHGKCSQANGRTKMSFQSCHWLWGEEGTAFSSRMCSAKQRDN